MGAWSNVTAVNSETYVVSSASNVTSSSSATTMYGAPRRANSTYSEPSFTEPSFTENDLRLFFDEARRAICELIAFMRVLHELLMQQEDQRERSRPPPRLSVAPEDVVRTRRRPPPRAPPVNTIATPDPIADQVGRRSLGTKKRFATIAT